MKPEAQVIALAMACGWKHHASDVSPHWDWWEHPDGIERNNHQYSGPPDYLSDRNATARARKIVFISRQQWARHHRDLSEVVGDDFTWNATAAQETEAILKTLGLWTA